MSCRELSCYNGGSCALTTRGARCTCNPGFGGPQCQHRSNEGCASQPCRNSGLCTEETSFPYFHCQCPSGYTGKRCEQTSRVLEPPTPSCPLADCLGKANDGVCDRECNIFPCHWDGGDCSLAVNPWSRCAHCWRAFNNSVCDESCNNVDCLYDNFDCKSKEKVCKWVLLFLFFFLTYHRSENLSWSQCFCHLQSNIWNLLYRPLCWWTVWPGLQHRGVWLGWLGLCSEGSRKNRQRCLGFGCPTASWGASPHRHSFSAEIKCNPTHITALSAGREWRSHDQTLHTPRSASQARAAASTGGHRVSQAYNIQKCCSLLYILCNTLKCASLLIPQLNSVPGNRQPYVCGRLFPFSRECSRLPWSPVSCRNAALPLSTQISPWWVRILKEHKMNY